MKTLLPVLLAVLCVAAAPTSQPATQPATQPSVGKQVREDAPEIADVVFYSDPDNRTRIIAELELKLAEAKLDLMAVVNGKIDAAAAEAVIRVTSPRLAYVFKNVKVKAATRAEKAERIEKWKRRIEYVKYISTVPIPELTFRHDLKEGAAGIAGELEFDRGLTTVTQVVDGNNVLISLHVIGGGDRREQVPVWVSEVDTSGMTDGQLFPQTLIIITGTKAYKTVLGAQNTVLKAEQFRLEKYLTD